MHIYLHIPFCKQACSYCNFHFSTSMKGRQALLAAMQREIRFKQAHFTEPIETIYFGGGTPSLLTEQELNAFFAVIAEVNSKALANGLQSSYATPGSPANKAAEVPSSTPQAVTATPNRMIHKDIEITLEANPDDLTEATVAMLAASPVNRLSIGLQSFAEEDLRFMNRAHSAAESSLAMERVLAAGFTDLSVDLIYGSPTTTNAVWKDNIQRVLDFQVPHISAYALTVEHKTALAHRVKTGQSPAPNETRFAQQFDLLIAELGKAGYEHYEISNFALPGRYSRHNTAYWQGKPYVGIGPGAHGFNGQDERYWNIANNALYTKNMLACKDEHDFAVKSGLYVKETLSLADRYNEFIMTGLRTKWGVSLADVQERFGTEFMTYLEQSLAVHKKAGYFEVSGLQTGNYLLTPAGRHLADGIAADAFWVVETA